MLSLRSKKNIIGKILIVIAVCFILSNCYTNYYFPIEVEEVKVSPAYRLEIQNDTSQLLTFLPREDAGQGVEEKYYSS